jgi:UDP-GlcNAc3NAcA epimerase
MKVLFIVRARPQFIKAAQVSRALRRRHTEVLVHNGQHSDNTMSRVYFDEMEIPPPCQGEQTGAMLVRLEETLLAERPDWTLVYSDTNSTFSGALAAGKLNIPLAHIEAGSRSFNRTIPEEINHLVTAHLSDLLLCPSQSAVDNLAAEGITGSVQIVGDVMMDTLLAASERPRN